MSRLTEKNRFNHGKGSSVQTLYATNCVYSRPHSIQNRGEKSNSKPLTSHTGSRTGVLIEPPELRLVPAVPGRLSERFATSCKPPFMSSLILRSTDPKKVETIADSLQAPLEFEQLFLRISAQVAAFNGPHSEFYSALTDEMASFINSLKDASTASLQLYQRISLLPSLIKVTEEIIL